MPLGELRSFGLCSQKHDNLMNGGSKMNTDQMKGNWKQLVGKAKEKWGKLTDNDWQIVEGKRDQPSAEFRSATELLAKKRSVR